MAPVTELRIVPRARLAARRGISPETESWIRNVIVPALVNEWTAAHGVEKDIAQPPELGASSAEATPQVEVGK